MLNIEINEQTKKVFDDLITAGAKVYFVGGVIRDALLHSPAKDIDVEVHHLPYEKLMAILSRHGQVRTFGASFAVVHLDTLPHVEFALPRIETKIGQSHRDFQVSADPDLDLKTACARRDFTINAMMADYETGQLYDFYGGRNDLEDGILRIVSPVHFGEDPLRVLRAASFIARYMLKADPQLLTICSQMVSNRALDHLSRERIYNEYSQILMGTQPSLGFNFLKDIDALPSYLKDLVTCMQRPDYHPEGSVWNHTMLVTDLCANIKDDTSFPLAFMWSGLLHDIGKPAVTTAEGHAHRHNEAGVTVFDRDVHLIEDKKIRHYVRSMIYHHMFLMYMATNKARPVQFKRLLKSIEGSFPLEDLRWFTICDKMGRGYIASEQIEMFNNYVNGMILKCGDHAAAPLVTGRDLIANGFEDHKAYHDLLAKAYDYQLQGLSKEKILGRLKSER